MATTVFPESGDQITEAAWSTQNQALTVAERFRVNGYTLSAGTGLNADVAAGTCVVNGYHIVSDGTQAVSVTASQTNYIWLNEDGTLSSNTTGTNPGSELLLGTAVTDGSGVTSVSHDHDRVNSRSVYIVKPSDETVNNSTTLQNDDDLAFAVTDGSQWEVDVFILGRQAAAVGFDFQMVGSGGSTITQQGYAYGNNGATTFTSGYGTTEVRWGLGATGSDYSCHLKFFITSSGAGTATLQWAQGSASATDSTIKAGSVMIARRILG